MFFSKKPQQPQQPPTAKQLLEEDLRTAYEHLDALKKVPTRNLNIFPTYVMAYWTIKDRINQLEQQYNQLSNESRTV